MNEKILKEILQELKDIHFHLDRLDTFYMFVNRVEMKGEVKKEIKGKEVTKDKK